MDKLPVSFIHTYTRIHRCTSSRDQAQTHRVCSWYCNGEKVSRLTSCRNIRDMRVGEISGSNFIRTFLNSSKSRRPEPSASASKKTCFNSFRRSVFTFACAFKLCGKERSAKRDRVHAQGTKTNRFELFAFLRLKK